MAREARGNEFRNRTRWLLKIQTLVYTRGTLILGALVSMRCFVAMALNRTDTDALYDRSLAPILRAEGVTPVRVDRLQHNDDLDDRIIAEIQGCDFLLADLTYARPSVYFEAGYGQRQAPVIYTCRTDHFSAVPNDEYGNFRVHFDLQMKNIICWSSPSDKVFQKKLAGRVAHVIGPILRRIERVQREREEIDEFRSLPITERKERLAAVCIRRLVERGYCRDATPGRHPSIRHSPLFAKFVGTKAEKATIQAALLFIAPSFTKTWLRWELLQALREEPLYDLNPRPGRKGLSRLVEHIFICTLQKAPLSRIMSMLSSFRLDTRTSELTLDRKQVVPRSRMGGFSSVYFHRALGGQPRLTGYTKETAKNDESWTECSVAGEKLIDPTGQRVGYVRVVPRHTHIRVFDEIKSDAALNSKFSEALEQIEGEVFSP